MTKPPDINFLAALRNPDIRLFTAAVCFFTLGSRALAVVIGFQIYQLTGSVLALGWLGLIEAIPALSLVLFGGYVADHYNRQRILSITRLSSFACALVLAALSFQSQNVLSLYAVIFLAGIARGFADPANTALEAQVVPRNLTVNAASWISGAWISCSVLGPAVIGFTFYSAGALGSYLLIAAFFLLSWACTVLLAPQPQIKPHQKEPLLKSISMGWHFVANSQALLAAMALDLFAVFFGGAVALLPVYAKDILHVGAQGLGLLNAAPSLGALIIMIAATRYAPRLISHAGRNLLLAVTGFGLSILVFAYSKDFWLSIGALTFSGVFDGVSMVIRRSLVRLLSPDHMRGRISAVNWIFICSSNELGAFESGMVAAWLGTVRCVALGGLITLAVAGSTAVWAPQLRRLRFDPVTLERRS